MEQGGHGRVLHANATLCRMLGLSLEELMNTPLGELTHPDDAEVTEAYRAKVRARVCAQVEKRYRHKDGHYVWMLASSVPLLGADGSPEADLAHFSDITETKQSEAELAASEHRFRSVLETTTDGFWRYDAERRIRFANARIAQMLGCTPKSLLSSSLDDFLFPEDRPGSVRRQRERRDGMQHGVYEFRLRRVDGSELWVEVVSGAQFDPDGNYTGGFALVRDISQRRQAERELTRASKMQHAILSHLPGTTAILFDFELRCMLIDGAAVQNTEERSLAGRALVELPWLTAKQKFEMAEHCRAALSGETRTYDTAVSDRDYRTVVSPVRDADGRIYAGLLTALDVTEQRQSERRLTELTERDPLTGLANRAAFRAELERHLSDDSAPGGAVMYLDLDNFKAVNDALGHDAGDELLRRVAERLAGSVRDGDLVTRLSGDEFCILVRGVDDRQALSATANRVLESLALPVSIAGAELFLGASLGIARLGRDGVDVGALLKAADMAMYAAKNEGRGDFRFFRAEMAERANCRLALHSQLHRALERGEFLLQFQPQLELPSERISSVEALVRWKHPQRGLVLPDEFISLSEESGFIVALGDWVLHSACEQLAAWRLQGVDIPKVAVNVSVKQLMHPEFPRMVASALEHSGLPAGVLELEITESALMDPDRSVAILTGLKELGVSIAIDDFGTGYSSLARLRHLPIDVLKVDRAFVADADTDPDAAAVVRSIVSLAHNLGMQALAEGVERQAQRDLLLEDGCDIAGGWLWSRALPADELADWLSRRHGPTLRAVA